MKKVRFEMFQESDALRNIDCHTPRPYVQESIKTRRVDGGMKTNLGAVHLIECSNSVPYPSFNRTQLIKRWSDPDNNDKLLPSDDLELSFLDGKRTSYGFNECEVSDVTHDFFLKHNDSKINLIKNKQSHNETIYNKENVIFPRNVNDQNQHINGLTQSGNIQYKGSNPVNKKINSYNNDFICHCCNKQVHNFICTGVGMNREPAKSAQSKCHNDFCRSSPISSCYIECTCNSVPKISSCHKTCRSASLNDAVELKNMAVQRFEQNRRFSTESERNELTSKGKYEPTVADLFQIIKLQNEQLQLLQEKVDKFIDASKNQMQNIPVQTCMKHVALESLAHNEHKMSIGVMTSFEVLRTSIINQGLPKHPTENAQIQCNRSQISIKELVTKTSPVNINFLDGIQSNNKKQENNNAAEINIVNVDSDNEEKTVHESSLCNFQVENEITPELSPDQSLYLELKDYSESESDNERSNVGWTYYNKVMTHVNDVLQDSEIPSSASALYQETLQRCMQMKFDKTNFSTSKRVTFGNAQLSNGHAQGTTDTSLKMKELAAKYLRGSATAPLMFQTPQIDNIAFPDNILDNQMPHSSSKRVPTSNPTQIPKFLDITMLKQQPKLI